MRKFSFIFVVFIVSCINCFADEMINGTPQTGAGASNVEDTAWASGWNGDTSNAPSQNALHDILVKIDANYDGVLDGDLSSCTNAQGSTGAFNYETWNGSTAAPTQNAIADWWNDSLVPTFANVDAPESISAPWKFLDSVLLGFGTGTDYTIGTDGGSNLALSSDNASDTNLVLSNEGGGSFNISIPTGGEYQINGVALAASDVGAQATNAYLSDIAGLTPTATAVIGWNTAGTDLETKSQLLLGSNLVFTLPDAAGAYAITGLNSVGSTIFSVNSLGQMSVPSINEDLQVARVVDMTADGISDDSYTGAVLLKGKTSGESLTQWDLVYQSTDGAFYKADGSVGSNKWPACGIVTSTVGSGSSIVVLREGFVRNDEWAFSGAGSQLYMSITSGQISESGPTTSGDCWQLIGTTQSDDEAHISIDGNFGIVN